MIIETERLILRPWRVSDAQSLYEYAKDPDVGPIAGWPVHTDVDMSLGVIKNVFCGKECYAVCLKEDNKAIGCIELMLNGSTNNMTEKDDECELGYWIGKPFWGHEYIPEAANALIERAFCELSMSAIWCGYYGGNVKSKRVQEKCGFEFYKTVPDEPVPLLNEKRICHKSLLTKEHWLSLNKNI